MLKGNNLILSIDGTPLGASRSCSIDRSTDTIEKCSPVDGPARSFIPSTTSWSISAGGLYANTAGADRLRAIWCKQQRGDQTPLRVGLTLEGKPEQGEAILTSLQETGNIGELVKFTIQLQGSGPLYRAETKKTVSRVQDRLLVFDADTVRYIDEPRIEACLTEFYFSRPGKLFIDCGGDSQKWAVCHFREADYIQDIDGGRDMQYYERGEGEATVTIRQAGWFTIMSDDSMNNPTVTALFIE